MLGNGIRCTTATTGTTGVLTLASVAGYPQVGDWFNDGDAVAYSAVDSTGAPLEEGFGVYTATGTTLTRTLITATYAAGVLTKNGTIAAATLAGTTTIYVSAICGTFQPGRKTMVRNGSGPAATLIAAGPDG